MKRRIIISERQSKELARLLNEEMYQMPVDKKMNKPYCINPDKVLIVKKFLDKGFTPHDYEKIGENGLPVKIKVVSMNASNGEPLKWMYKEQLHDLLIDKFQNMFSDANERSLFLKQVMDDWFNGAISIFGGLSKNKLMESISSEEITAEASNVNTDPTDAQKEAGNYRMAHISVKGMRISIENPKGSYRKFKKDNGEEGKTLMKNHYGYFNITKGKDGDAVDVFIGPNIENFKNVYCVDQNNKQGEFDETKVMLGFDSKEEAKQAYLSNYDPDWKGFRKITGVSLKHFKQWLYRGRKQRQPFADYVIIKKRKIEESKVLKENIEMDDNLSDLPPMELYKYVRTHDKYGNEKEERLGPPYEDWKRVRNKEGKMNLKNIATDEYISDAWYDWIGYIVKGLAIVNDLDRGYNLININGEVMLPEWHEDVDVCDDGDAYYLIDGDEKVKISREEIV